MLLSFLRVGFLDMEDLQLALAKITEFEGAIPWMYRDNAGTVTVGVGMTLANVTAAGQLPFRVDGHEADRAEIGAEFARITALPMGRAALFYRRPGAPELGVAEMEQLAKQTLTQLKDELAEKVEGFAAMPEDARAVLLDMAYSLGVPELLERHARMLRAAQAGEWGHAAGASFRHGAGAARNAWTRETFLACTTGTQRDGHLKRLGYGCLGMAASWFGR